ncbi:MAG: HAMP domain-containing histidine kinase [Phycisphaerales bacterium]|nr:HAMP domain-containing histidine kinase [Phycisphaerales bacterium]
MDPNPHQPEHSEPNELPRFDDQASRLAELGSLASMLAHEINNLLTRAQGRVQLALLHPPTPSLRHANSHDAPTAPSHEATLEQVLDILRQTTRLTESMMHYASPSRGPTDSVVPASDIRDAHTIARGLLAPHTRNGALAPIEYETSWNTAGHTASIDPVALEQILINLYLNAENAIRTQQQLDANTPGLVLVSGALECSTWNTPTIRITVQDTGVGIPPADLLTIFEPWKQGDLIADRKKGFGLGLAVCQKLIREAGGTISCDSAPGIGSRFTIILPAAKALDEAQSEPGGLAA